MCTWHVCIDWVKIAGGPKLQKGGKHRGLESSYFY